ncbi:hypothetical protein AB0D49_33160 [Streptomyces sp. NPDC048290]|uniref:helix-turn-helix transcriptional regulator n=1 Tax=Streptomyces sp. NPDC048290 TaxID=3155811 RepID=UPI00344A0375
MSEFHLASPPAPPELTAVDLELLRMIATSHTLNAIARHFSYQPRTISERLNRLRSAVGADTTWHAASLAVLHRFITDTDVALPSPRPRLNGAQTRVLHEVLTRHSATDIAARLDISKRTVDTVLTQLRTAFAAKTRNQLAAAALLTDSVTCSAADTRFPNVPLSQFLATRPGQAPAPAPAAVPRTAVAPR